MNGKTMNTIIAVDKDADVHMRETAEWANYGIEAFRIDTMAEAINLLSHSGNYLFVVINEDTIPDFMLKLRLLRDVTSLPIFVITSNYTIEKKLKAMDYGADAYDHFDAYIKKDVIGELESLKEQAKWAKRPAKPPVLTGGDIILSPLRRCVLIKDNLAPLTRKEFDVLQCLMSGNGHVVTHPKLIRKVWGDKHSLKNTDILWRTVDRLRRKIAELSPTEEYIEIERGVGYRFSLPLK